MKLIWIVYHNLKTFFKTQSVMAFFMIFTIFLTSFSAILLLRLGWVEYQNELELSNSGHNYNSIMWKHEATINQKQSLIEDILSLNDMPSIVNVECGENMFLSKNEMQKQWQKQGNSNKLSLHENSIILNEDIAKSNHIKINDKYIYEDIEYIVSGIWNLSNTFILSNDKIPLMVGNSISVYYEKLLDQKQNERLSEVINQYDNLYEVSLLYDRQQSMFHDFIKNVYGCLGIAMIGGFNTLFLVWFWNKHNKKTYRVYHLCGGRNGYIEWIQLIQMLTLVFIGWLISCVIYYATIPLQNMLFVNYEVYSLLPLSILLGVGICLLFLHTLLFLPLYAWQEG